jgi:hypothetical protein
MSYDKPEFIPDSQIDDAIIWHNTSEVLRELSNELSKFGLTFRVHKYYKNEYCGNRPEKCGCPHWMLIQILNNYERIYKPHCYIWICKRKRVYELRYHDMTDSDFWINNTNDRTQGEGYIHSYGLRQTAEDIAKIYQASEIHDYKSEKFKEYYLKLFQKKSGE